MFKKDKLKKIYYCTNILMKKGLSMDKNYNGELIFWLSKRINQRKAMFNCYQPPGGKIDKGDTRKETLIKETSEETVIKQDKKDYIYEFTQIHENQLQERDKGIR